MSSIPVDDYEHYNYEEFPGKGGKHRSKVEIEKNTNKPDTCGHTRKILQKLVNTEHNKREIKK